MHISCCYITASLLIGSHKKCRAVHAMNRISDLFNILSLKSKRITHSFFCRTCHVKDNTMSVLPTIFFYTLRTCLDAQFLPLCCRPRFSTLCRFRSSSRKIVVVKKSEQGIVLKRQVILRRSASIPVALTDAYNQLI